MDSSDLPDVVTFADGEGLRSGTWQVRWNHTGLWDGGYTYVLSTGGQDEGLWDYTQNATGCDVLLIQAEYVEGADDLAASDDALAEFSEMNPSALGDVVFESTARISGSPSRLQFRAVAAKREGASEHAQVHSTRVLTAADAELSMKIECPEGIDAIDSANLLLGDLAVDIRRSRERLDFEASAGLVPDQSIWEDSAVVGGGNWTLTTPDDGGSWGYTSADGDCTANFQQSRLDETVTTAPDDRVATDRAMAWYYGWTEDDVSSDALERDMGFGPPANRVVAARTIEAVNDSGMNGILAARAFRQSGLAFFIDVWCTQRVPADALEEILGSASIVPPGW
ncbi:hypothetical protein [Microbacterium sp. SS28]|uniref:hypothetical protein n=1 Tax=Microbacterium sp. SS28 TaxID=2919948 RepID=UPI001FAAB482|nr:hypothetical protein [Microbacterium sp. SS28]